MKKTIEAFGTGATSEEALKAAEKELNAPANVTIGKEIVDVQEKKILGLFRGATVYKARAYYEKEIEQPKVQTPAPTKKPVEKTQKNEPKKPVKKEAVVEKAPAEEKKPGTVTVDEDGKAQKYLRNILKGLSIDDVKITTEKNDESISFQLDCGEDYGCVIGRRGETLDAIQYLTRLVVNRENDDYKRVTVNVGNYREKRANTLTELAKRNADKVIKYGRNVVLEPMNPYERRVIHTAIQQYENVESYSIGSDDSRRVVIKLVDGVKPTHSGSGYNKGGSRGGQRGGYNKPRNNNSRSQSAPKQNTAPKSDASAASLYGKIEPKAKSNSEE